MASDSSHTVRSTPALMRVLEAVVRRRMGGEDLPDRDVIAAHPDLMPELGEQLRGLRVADGAERVVQAGEAAAASGQSLASYMVHDAPTLRERVGVLRDVCLTVHELHVSGVRHVGLTLEGLRVDSARQVRLPARGAPIDTYLMDLNQTEAQAGPLSWAAPEQVAADGVSVDARADVYTLGVLIYRLLAGQFPYCVVGRRQDIVEHILHTQPQTFEQSTAGVDAELRTIVAQALHKNPAHRYASAAELAADLTAWLDGGVVAACGSGTAYLLHKHLRRHRIGLAIAGLAIAGVLLLIVMT